jgi:hypothetical protein
MTRLLRCLRGRSFLPILCFFLPVACSSNGSPAGTVEHPGDPQPGDNAFMSDDPNGDSASVSRGGDAGAAGAPTASGDNAQSPGGQEAARAIEEADIIQMNGNKLYALSEHGGLSVIDVSNPSAMSLLGRYRTSAMPFEMYSRDGILMVMYNGFGQYIYDETSYAASWVQSSRILALDVRDPAHIAKLGDFTIPGEVSDSRLVGDVMYVVAHENGYCWRCAENPTSTVISLNVSDPLHVAKIDEKRFASPDKYWSGWKRSVSATNQRMYVAGVEYGWNESGSSPPHSNVQVIDITDPNGTMKLGKSFPVDGQIQSRWQMDEADGVLRVVSQGWWGWGASIEPTLQTYTVASADVITPLARLPITLPAREQLQSVRFDGPRGYVVTAERRDPLFTLDITDPAKPKQMGQVEMPGFLYHMEPRGDRLVAIGYDQGNADGSLTVSLFDVANLASPTLLQRVNFGKGFASLAEDQDRVQKLFKVLDTEKMILVPFSSSGQWWSSGTGEYTCDKPQSGIQIIDWANDTLTLRAVAPQAGSPRRAFLSNGTLFGVSDNNVSAFDITDHGSPKTLGAIGLVNPSNQAVVAGNNLVQLSHDWFTGAARILVTSKDDPSGVLLGSLDLTELAVSPETNDFCSYYRYWDYWYDSKLFVDGNLVYFVTAPRQNWDYRGQPSLNAQSILATIDLNDPSKPKIVGKAWAQIPLYDGSYLGGWWGGWGYYGYGQYGFLGNGDATVRTGTTVSTLTTTYRYGSSGPGHITNALVTFDFSNPAQPKFGAQVPLAADVGYSGLLVDGDTVYTSHAEPVQDMPGKVRFYVDRIQPANAGSPTILQKINVPGSLVHIDVPHARAVTVDYRYDVHPAQGYEDCYRGEVNAWFDGATNLCHGVQRFLRDVALGSTSATLLSSLEMPRRLVGSARSGDDRLFMLSSPEYYWWGYYGGVADVPGGAVVNAPVRDNRAHLVVVDGIREGALRFASTTPLDTPYGGWLWARGTTALVSSNERTVSVFDTTNAATPALLRKVELSGYGYAYDVTMTDDRAYCSLGEFGVDTVSLAP